MKRCSEAFMSKFKHIRLAGTDFEPHKTNVERWGWADIPSYNLIREPNNKHDPNAIGVYFLRDRLGYIKRDLAAQLAPTMDSGKQYYAVFVKRNTCSWTDTVGLTVSVYELC
jgi:hypothetical protein